MHRVLLQVAVRAHLLPVASIAQHHATLVYCEAALRRSTPPSQLAIITKKHLEPEKYASLELLEDVQVPPPAAKRGRFQLANDDDDFR